VSLELGNETHTRQLSRRRSGRVVTDGDPYLDDPTLADLFVFLLRSNEARRAVAAQDDLRELIMEPIDTATIQSKSTSSSRRESLRHELDEIDEIKGDLPELEERRTRLRQEIEGKRAELEAKEAELEAADADVEEAREEKSGT